MWQGSNDSDSVLHFAPTVTPILYINATPATAVSYTTMAILQLGVDNILGFAFLSAFCG